MHAETDRQTAVRALTRGSQKGPASEWAAAKHGGKGQRGWQKLHLGVDANGVIVAHEITESRADDAVTALALIEDVKVPVSGLTADTAYDSNAIYHAATERGARVVIPPVKSSTSSSRKRNMVTS